MLITLVDELDELFLHLLLHQILFIESVYDEHDDIEQHDEDEVHFLHDKIDMHVYVVYTDEIDDMDIIVIYLEQWWDMVVDEEVLHLLRLIQFDEPLEQGDDIEQIDAVDITQ